MDIGGLSNKFEICFMCPQCHRSMVFDDDRVADSYDDIENDDYMECKGCGAGYLAKRTEYGLKLLNIEEHEFDNDLEGSGRPQTTTFEEDLPAFQHEPTFEEDVALHTGIDTGRNKDMTFEDYVASFGLGTADMTDEDYDMWQDQYNQYINFSESIQGAQSMKYSTLVDKLTKLTKEFMISKGFPEDEVVEYFTVDVSPTEDGAYTQVQVRAELDFGEMTELSNSLNPIVAEIDDEAYFDMDEPGIMTAMVKSNLITSSTKIQASDLRNYGGAFDIDPYAFWTKEELDELGNNVAQNANKWLERREYVGGISLIGAYLEDDYETITLEFDDYEGYTYEISKMIDMRRIRKPSDLSYKYEDDYVAELINQYMHNHDWYQLSE